MLLWARLTPTERRRLLDSTMFDSVWATIRNTSAYPRLLSALREHDLSPTGHRFGDAFLVELAKKMLLRSGNSVNYGFRTQTVFDDLLEFCLVGYRKAAAKQKRQQRPADAAAKAIRDVEEVMFEHLDAARRKRLMDGPMFSQSVLSAIRGTGAYTRLLAEVRSLNNGRLKLGDEILMTWLEQVLLGQGSSVAQYSTSQTIFGDLVIHCRAKYFAWSKVQHSAQQQEKRRREEEARQQAEAILDVEEVMFERLDAARRKKLMEGQMFSQGVLNAIQATSVYNRLLAEVRSLNSGRLGVKLGDEILMTWLAQVLSRQGSSVPQYSTSQTMFDDLVVCCRAEYFAKTWVKPDLQQQEKAQREEAARRQAEALRQEQEHQAAQQRQKRQQQEAERVKRENEARERQKREQQQADARRQEQERQAEERRKQESERVMRENKVSLDDILEKYRQAPGTQYAYAPAKNFSKAFEQRSEGLLYLKVARQQVGANGTVTAYLRAGRRVRDDVDVQSVTSATGKLVVKLLVTAELKDQIDLAFRKALYDLQKAAASLRDEAAKTRDEAIKRAEAAYAAECGVAFEIVVNRYVA